MPVVYGAAKLAGSGERDLIVPGIMATFLLPLPPLLFWLYVLWPARLFEPLTSSESRSMSSNSAENDNKVDVHQRSVRLDLLGIGTDENPTLILRARNTASSDDSEISSIKVSDAEKLGTNTSVNTPRPPATKRPVRHKADDGKTWPAAGANFTCVITKIVSERNEVITNAQPHLYNAFLGIASASGAAVMTSEKMLALPGQALRSSANINGAAAGNGESCVTHVVGNSALQNTQNQLNDQHTRIE